MRRAASGVLGLFAALSYPAAADCRIELELLSADLHDVKLTEPQMQSLAALVDDALKRCGMGWEAAALAYIERARAVAGIPRRDELEDGPGEVSVKPAPPRPDRQP